MFHENWYSDKQLKDLCKLAKTTTNLEGDIIEI